MDIEKYRALFVEEASDHLGEMSRALAVLESRSGGDAGEAIDTLFRMAHSIKGMASSLDYGSLAELAHRLEDWLEPLRQAGVLPDAALPRVYRVVGALEEMVATVADTGAPPEARKELLAELDQPVELDPALGVPAEEAGTLSKKEPSPPRRRCRVRSGYAPRRSIGSWPLSVS